MCGEGGGGGAIFSQYLQKKMFPVLKNDIKCYFIMHLVSSKISPHFQ